MVPDQPTGLRRAGHHGRALPTMAAAIRAMDSLPDRDYTFVDLRGGHRKIAYPELGRASREAGAGLLAAGCAPAKPLAILATDPFDAFRAVFGAFAAGIVPVMLPPPGILGDTAAYLEGLRDQLEPLGVDTLLMDDGSFDLLGPRLGALPGFACLTLGSLGTGDPAHLPDPDAIPSSSTALLQFTSGSGSRAKAVAVSHANLCANSRAIYIDGIGISVEDRLVSWLPRYHDMGLIGHLICPAREGLSAVLYPTASFLKRPSSWMESVSRHRATIACAPNFAFALAARGRPAQGLDLSCLRVLGCGAEPIQARTLRDFVTAHRPLGLRAECLVPCYGLAEHTLAATFSPVGTGMATEVVSASRYRESARAEPAGAGEEGIEFVDCGPAFPGHAVAILEPGTDRELGEGCVGEIVLSGPSVTLGYLDRPDAAAAAFRKGSSRGSVLRTGDLGYLRGNHLFVTGRLKDLIIINGRNFDPQHIEAAVEKVEQVRAGSAFAFSIPGAATERLIILYESRLPYALETDRKIRSVVSGEFGLMPHDVVAHKAHVLPKTTSGKKRRALAREDYLKGRQAHAVLTP